jgi:phosphohistidine swiveling domain-containing protein
MKLWTREESKERFPRPISPLGWSLLQVPMQATLDQMSQTLGIKRYRAQELMLCHQNYIYTQKNFFKDLRNLRFQCSRVLFFLLQGVRIFIQELFVGPAKGPYLSRVLQSLFLRLFQAELDRLVTGRTKKLETLKALMGRDFNLNSGEPLSFEKFLTVRKQMQDDSKEFFAEDFNVYFLKNLLISLLKLQLKHSGLSPVKAESLVAALSQNLKGNFSVEMIQRFSDPRISTEELKKYYGHLTDNWDLLNPTFAEQDGIWELRDLGTLRGSPELAPNTSVSAFEAHLSWNSRLGYLVAALQELILLDEDLRAYSSLQYPQARILMRQVEETSEWRQLELAQDSIYFLSLDELERALQNKNFERLKGMILERKQSFARALKMDPPEELVEEDGILKAVSPVQKVAPALLSGVMVSGGVVEGTVHHVRSYQDLEKIHRHSILVLESATPVFSPFYALCAGIISEVGGSLSHGAIVARECGIPMLTAVQNACGLLEEGQRVSLDANQGLVRVVENERH